MIYVALPNGLFGKEVSRSLQGCLRKIKIIMSNAEEVSRRFHVFDMWYILVNWCYNVLDNLVNSYAQNLPKLLV